MRGKAGGRHRYQDAQCAIGERETEESTHGSEDDAFEEEVRRDALPSRTESRADRQLLAPSFDAHQQQVCDVGAGHQQHHGDGAHQDPQHVADVADDVLLQRTKIRLEVCLLK